MATVVETSINITEDNAKTYCWADTLQLEDRTYAFALYLDGHTDGWAHLNDAAKAILYPTETARPFKLDSSITGSRSGGTMYVTLEFDGTAVHEVKVTGTSKKEYAQTDITHDLISSSTRATDIAWQVDGSSTVSDFRVKETTVKMYFNKYDVYGYPANKAKGVKEIHVSNNHPYHGDIVTVTVDLHEGAKWYGWYADPEHTQLLSLDKDMEFDSSGDITAYAYATLGTGFRFKKDGQWVNSIGIYRKEFGMWFEIDKSEVDVTSTRYMMYQPTSDEAPK